MAHEMMTVMQAVAARLPRERSLASGAIVVSVEGDEVVLPDRIYATQLASAAVAALSPAEALALHCLYTRHHDGFVRARHLVPVLASDAPWAVPFVLQLIGEYVLPIVLTIAESLDLAPGSADGDRYHRFIVANPRFFETTASRVVSYWNCYHRPQYPRWADYPGAVLLARLRACRAA